MERTPDRTNPRERLSQMELAEVNREADRMVRRVRTDHSRAAVSRALAERVAKGRNITEAMFATMDALRAAPGAICPIEDVPDVQTDDISVTSTIETPSGSSVARRSGKSASSRMKLSESNSRAG
jgi:hypothetical protein